MSRKHPPNLLELIPERKAGWEKSAEELVIVLLPKFHHPWLVRWILPLLSKPYLRVHLDELGSYLWMQCDGRRDVQQITGDLSIRFAQPPEMLLDRMARFFRHLESEKALILKRNEETDAPRIGNQAAGL